MLPQLDGRNIVVYDCEIKNVIDGKNVTWSTYDKMGLSVACLFDYSTGDNHVYLENDIDELVNRLNNADLVVGFHTTGFDNNLIKALCGRLKPSDELKNYDMLYQSRIAMGWDKTRKFPSGMKLDDHLESTFGAEHKKTLNGEQAPIDWQNGKVAKVITYCLADVKREKMLFEHIVQHGWVSTATHGKKYLDLSLINRLL